MSSGAAQRRWGGVYELLDMLEAVPGGMAFAVRDFALVTLAAELSVTFPGQLVFKGGFVLRHAHGHLRFSKDIDATRHAPPTHKLDAGEVAAAIRNAGIRNVVQFEPGEPAIDSARSLDFDRVHVAGQAFPDSDVQVEVSFRDRSATPDNVQKHCSRQSPTSQPMGLESSSKPSASPTASAVSDAASEAASAASAAA